MTITRRALLISNPGEKGEENYCEGVYTDIANYKRLLLSPVGGWWSESEIEHLDKPTVSEVKNKITALSTHDYVFIVFSGHGWYSSVDRDRVLQLRKNEHLASLDLHNGAKKRTVILDCCQKVYAEPIMEQRKLAANAEIFKSFARKSPDGPSCRRLFLRTIEEIPNCIVRTVSCAQNEVASDSKERGGLYNGSLIECVDDWTKEQSRGNTSQGAAYSIVSAHQCASSETIRRSGGTQNPEIDPKPRSSPYFPIAVFI